mgnify:CR=1 FL=1
MSALRQKILIILVGLVFALAWAPTASASFSDFIRALVAVSPLEVKVSAPGEAVVGQNIHASAALKNKGVEAILNAQAEIFPSGLTLFRGDKIQVLGTILPQEEKFAFWSLRGIKAGNYVISVKASGELGEETISDQKSALIRIRKEGRRLFFFEFWQKLLEIF